MLLCKFVWIKKETNIFTELENWKVCDVALP